MLLPLDSLFPAFSGHSSACFGAQLSRITKTPTEPNGATPARSGGWQKAGRKGVRRETLPVEGCAKLARMATGYAIGPERVGEERHATVFTRHN